MFTLTVKRADIILYDCDGPYATQMAYAVAMEAENIYVLDEFRYPTRLDAMRRLNQMVAEHPTVFTQANTEN